MPPSRPAPETRAGADAGTGADRTTDLIRWAAFSCVLVPVVLLWYGTSLAGAAGTALGLAAVTAVCRLLLRRSERCAALHPVEDHPSHAPHTHEPHGTQESHQSRRAQESQLARGSQALYGPRRGRRHRTGSGPRRGGRHSGGSSPVG